MIGAKMYNSIVALKDNGYSQRKIAETLGLSKTTVNKYCQMKEPQGMIDSCRRTGRSQFSVAEDYIRERLYHKPKLRSTRLYAEVLELYPGIRAKHRAFRHYLQKIRESVPKPQGRIFSIAETKPGKQIQVDMGEMRVDSSSGGQFKLYFCSFVLSFSRQLFVHCQTKPYNTEAFIEAHHQAFRYFEGLATDYVYDQTKLVAIHEKYREVLFNETFHQFSVKSGFHPVVCEGYDPQSKGKIERCIQEVKQDFLYGRVFADLADIRDKILAWLSKFNCRVHSTTGKIPKVLWEEEKAYLKPVPEICLQAQSRKADKTGLISYSGNKYSVPMPYQNRTVLIEEEIGALHILDLLDKQIVATHTIPASKGNIIKNNNHYRDLSLELSELKAKTIELFHKYDRSGDIIERLVKDNPSIPRDQLRAVGKMLARYNDQTWQQAISLVKEMPTLRATLIEEVLNGIVRRQRCENILLSHEKQSVGESALQRSLDEYMRVIEHDRNH